MKRVVSRLTILIPILSVLMLTPAFADDTLTVVATRVADTDLYETTPTLGNDGVVYTAREMLGTGGDIYYQPLWPTGARKGAPVFITSTDRDDKLYDISGDYIVFASYESNTSDTGTIVLYQISTGNRQAISDLTPIQEPRIHGNMVVWVQGPVDSSEVMLYDLADRLAEPLPGPIPPVSNVDIGDRLSGSRPVKVGRYGHTIG